MVGGSGDGGGGGGSRLLSRYSGGYEGGVGVEGGLGWDLGGDAPVVPRENLRKIRKSNSESPSIP